jgi:hypothetical protein
MEGYGNQLFTLKALLHSFSASTGLKVNFQKSMMVQIKVSQEKLLLARTFGCSIGSLILAFPSI